MLQFIFQQSTADTRWLRRRMATELSELLAKTSSGKIFESLTVRIQLYSSTTATFVNICDCDLPHVGRQIRQLCSCNQYVFHK